MSILTKEVEVMPSGKMIQYYKNLGYDVEWRKPLVVKIEDLQKSSKVKIEVLCDICKKNKMFVAYDNYNNVMARTGSYVCQECSAIKIKQTFLKRYGVEHIAKLKDIKDKKVRTNIERYGVDNPNKSPEIREKIVQTLYANSSQKVSKQQRYINNLYQGILNYPIKHYNVDIYLPDNNLIIEYDGGFHLGNVITGRETKEEFDQKEIIRNNIIKREGYKVIRIISSKDKLPSDQILLQMLQDARQYFVTTPHTWQTYDIDKSMLFNAENKNGTPYNFGELRTIKDSDINITEDNNIQI